MEEYLDLIRKIAWSYTKTTGMPFEDLFQEGCTAVLLQWDKYDAEKGQPTTFIHHVVTNHFNKIIRNNKKQHYNISLDEIPEYDIRLTDEDNSPENIFISKLEWENKVQQMDTDSKKICDIIFTNADNWPLDCPRKCRGLLVNLLHEQEGWSWNRIWKEMKTIKNIINS